MILDTNALSDLSKRNKGLTNIIGNATQLYTTLISLGEYEYGILGSKYASEFRTWLDALLNHVEVLSPYRETLPFYAAIRMELKRNATPIPANDVWIAALARQYKLTLVSRSQHFDLVEGIERLSW